MWQKALRVWCRIAPRWHRLQGALVKPRPKRGRPARAGNAATERIEIRVTRLELAEWRHHAALQGVSLSEWIRGRCSSSAPW